LSPGLRNTPFSISDLCRYPIQEVRRGKIRRWVDRWAPRVIDDLPLLDCLVHLSVPRMQLPQGCAHREGIVGGGRSMPPCDSRYFSAASLAVATACRRVGAHRLDVSDSNLRFHMVSPPPFSTWGRPEASDEYRIVRAARLTDPSALRSIHSIELRLGNYLKDGEAGRQSDTPENCPGWTPCRASLTPDGATPGSTSLMKPPSSTVGRPTSAGSTVNPRPP